MNSPDKIHQIVPGWSNQELLEFIKLGLFDGDFYLATNPDLQSAQVDPLLHFLEHGWREGRRPCSRISQTEMNFILNLKDEISNPLDIFRLNHTSRLSSQRSYE